MEYSQNLDHIRVDPVYCDPRRACNHKLASATDTAHPSKRRLPAQRLHCIIDPSTYAVRECECALVLDPGGDVLEVRERVGGPFNPDQEDSRAS
jgi:hypothetical protein